MEPEPAAPAVPTPDPNAEQAAPLGPPLPTTEKPRSLGGKLIHDLSPKWSLIRVLTFILVPVTIIQLLYLSFPRIEVVGISMEPTYHSGGRNLVNRLAYTLSLPHRGDVVAVTHKAVVLLDNGRPKRTTNGEPVIEVELLLKRVIGLPGETVKFDDGRLFIDGKSLEEPYALYGPYTNRANVVIQSSDWWTEGRKLRADEYWVIGDNRTMPPWLHTHPVVKRNAILGKALF